MLVITDEMIQEAEHRQRNLRMELAVALYASEVFDLRRAAEYAGVLWMHLATEIKNRSIPAWDAMTPEEFYEEWVMVKEHYFKK